MKYLVTVQASEYHEKVFIVESNNEKEAEENAIAAAEKEIIEDNEMEHWKYLGQDFDVFAPITCEEVGK